MASNDVLDPEFYSPWPKFGCKPLSRQWGEIRSNQETLHPITKAAGLDKDLVDRTGAALQAWELGEQDFHNKFRSYWDKDFNEYKLQANVGTENCPVWQTCIIINADTCDVIFSGSLRLDGGFYGNLTSSLSRVAEWPAGVSGIDPTDFYQVNELLFSAADGFYLQDDGSGNPVVRLTDKVKGSSGGGGLSNVNFTTTDLDGSFTPKTFSSDTLIFDRNDFYLSPDSSGDPVVSSTGDKTSVVAGDNVTVSRLGNEFTVSADVTSGFYGITVKQTDDAASFSGIGLVAFDSDDFYITQNDPNTDEAIVNFRGARVGDRGPQGPAGTAIGTVSATFASSSEWVFNHSIGETPLLWSAYDSNLEAIIPDKVDVSNENIAYFYFSAPIAGRAILSAGSASDFYGVTVKQSDDSAFFREVNVLSFEKDKFYITQNDPNTDEVQINFRGLSHGELSGLGEDDHTQYFLADGSRSLTGDLVVDKASTFDVDHTSNQDENIRIRLNDSGSSYSGAVFTPIDTTQSNLRSASFRGNNVVLVPKTVKFPAGAGNTFSTDENSVNSLVFDLNLGAAGALGSVVFESSSGSLPSLNVTLETTPVRVLINSGDDRLDLSTNSDININASSGSVGIDTDTSAGSFDINDTDLEFEHRTSPSRLVAGIGRGADGFLLSKVDEQFLLIESAGNTVVSNNDYAVLRVEGLGTTIQSGDTTDKLDTVRIAEPDGLLQGTGTVTDATSLRVDAAPTSGTNNRAFWIQAGLSEFEGDVDFNAGVDIDTANGLDINPGGDIDADLITVGVSGTPRIRWDEQADAFYITKRVNISSDVQLSGDTGGVPSSNTITGVTDTPTTDPGWSTSSTTDMNAPDGYIKAYVGTQAVVIPFWNT